MTIDEISYVFVQKGADPSIGGCIELKSLLLLAFNDSDLDLLAGDGAVNLIGGGLLYGLGGECLLGGRNDGKGIAEVVLRVVPVRL